MAGALECFPSDTLTFLSQLARNNNREWFQANKPRYEQSVRGPAVAFIHAMTDPLERKVSRHVFADPSRTGGSLMRIYRDTRFSADKTPYKTNVGIQFRHERGKDVHAPGLYLHIDPKECFLGCGIWKPPSDALAAVRARIAEHPKLWLAARDDKVFVRQWGRITGDTLQRPPRGFDPQHPCIEDLKRKDFLGVVDLPRELITSPKLVAHVTKAFAAGGSLMKFLCDALGLPY